MPSSQSARSRVKDCEPYEAKIQAALDEVIGRYNELLADVHGLYGLYWKNRNATTQWGNWTGHLYAYEQAQLDLQNAIPDAKDAGCPVSPEAEEWATKPLPLARNELESVNRT